MPTYTCTAAKGLLNDQNKRGIAQVITNAHAEITGAPAYFAQVFFTDVMQGDHFIGGKPLSHDHLFIYGRIRDGRSAVDRKALVKRITSEVAEVTDFPTFAVWTYILELPAAAMVEFGHILPEAGDEQSWNDALPEADRQRMQAILTS